MAANQHRPPLAPKHWAAWGAVGLLWIVTHLPLRAQFALGRLLGSLAHRIGGRRRHIAETNIAMCFPALDSAARSRLVKRTFESFGISFVETAYSWMRPLAPLMERFTVTGHDVVEAAIAQGRGVVAVGAHFSTLDLAGAYMQNTYDFDVMYRKSHNAVVEYMMLRARERTYTHVIDSHDIRTIMRLYKQGHVVWYAADQDYGYRQAVFAPFFGIEAATVGATARFARINDAPVIFVSHFRDEKALTWSVHIQRVDDYPTGDAVADATKLNGIIEAEIRKAPEQYLWLHRRFKTRPDPAEQSPYGPRRRRSKRRANASTEN